MSYVDYQLLTRLAIAIPLPVLVRTGIYKLHHTVRCTAAAVIPASPRISPLEVEGELGYCTCNGARDGGTRGAGLVEGCSACMYGIILQERLGLGFGLGNF